MALDAAEVVVGANGQIYVAPLDTPLPDDPDEALDTDFVELGYVSEDGATVTDSRSLENIGAWQSLYPIRRVVTEREFTVAFAMRQWNESTVPFAFGGGTVTTLPAAAGYKYEPPDPEEIDERALVIDWQDGDKNYRLVIPRGIVTENVESNLARASAADLPITFAALPVDDVTKLFTLYTDDPAFAPGS